MNRLPQRTPTSRLLFEFARRWLVNLYRHWLLAVLSLVAAFVIWFAVEDVENPTVTLTFPPDGQSPSVTVAAQNAGAYIVAANYSVRVVVEGREDAVLDLSPSDFDATVDVQGMQPGIEESREVKVSSRRDDIDVISVIPSQIRVMVVEPAVRELPVTIRRLGQLPAGFRENDAEIELEPAIVQVSGLPERVNAVQSVDLDVNLSGVKDETLVVTGTLVARSLSGSAETVTISPARATARIPIEQTFIQRTLPVRPEVTGSPAPGFRIASITTDVAGVTVTGERAVISDLQSVSTEPVDVGGARTEVKVIRNLIAPPNTSIDRRSVTITVELEAVESTATWVVAPTLTGLPAGLAIAPGTTLAVAVTVSGPSELIAALDAADIRAAVSLAGASAGAASYPVTVTVPSGLRFEQPAPLAVTLSPVAQ